MPRKTGLNRLQSQFLPFRNLQESQGRRRRLE